MASSCLGDRFAHGKWQHVRGIRDGERLHARNELLECGPRCNASELPCVSWEYGNSSCGPALNEARLCRALRCRSMLIVGDSTMGRLVSALSIYAGRSWVRTVPRYADGAYACPMTPPIIYELCANVSAACPRGNNVSYWRNDHLLRADGLLNRSMPGAEPAAACDWWRNESILTRYGDLLLLSRGAHVMEYTQDLRASRSFHAARANELAEAVLRPHLAAQRNRVAIILHAHWGALHATRREHGPLAAPEAPRPMWHWDLMPMISHVEVETLRRALPQAAANGLAAAPNASPHQDHRDEHEGRAGGTLIAVDPTRALSQRQDCRDNHLHVVSALYLASTWRMVQNALAALS